MKMRSPLAASRRAAHCPGGRATRNRWEGTGRNFGRCAKGVPPLPLRAGGGVLSLKDRSYAVRLWSQALSCLGVSLHLYVQVCPLGPYAGQGGCCARREEIFYCVEVRPLNAD